MEDGNDKQLIPPGTEVQFANRPRDAASFTVEGLAGLAHTNGLVKINLFEQLMEIDTPGQMTGRYNVLLNIPTQQFLAIEEVLRRIAEDIINGAMGSDAPATTKKET